MCKRHEEAAAAKADLSAAVEKDQKHEGEKPGRPRTGRRVAEETASAGRECARLRRVPCLLKNQPSSTARWLRLTETERAGRPRQGGAAWRLAQLSAKATWLEPAGWGVRSAFINYEAGPGLLPGAAPENTRPGPARLLWYLLEGEKTQEQVCRRPALEVHTDGGQPLRRNLPDGDEIEQKKKAHVKAKCEKKTFSW